MKISKRYLFLSILCLAAAAVLLSQTPVHPTSAMNAQPESVLRSRQPGYLDLVFNDEFDGTGLDNNKWATCYWWAKDGCTNEGNNELQWYQRQNISVTDGVLHLTAQKQAVNGTNGKSYPYTSAMVTTGRMVENTQESARYPFLYGYVEVRAKFPAGKGLWPAIWMLPSDQVSKPEIDIMEVLGDETKTVHMNYHFLDQNEAYQRSDGGWNSPKDLAGEWHTYAVNWEPDSITWYIDGEKRREFTDPAYIPHQPMYLLINLAVGGDWPGAPDANTTFPSTFEIDYVRIWKPVSAQTLQASEDAFVDSDNPGTNYGKSTTMDVDGSPRRIAYLKFDLSGLAGKQIDSAVLRVRVSGEGDSGSQNSQAVYSVGDGWKEDTITFENRPQINTYIIGLLENTEPNVTYDIQLNAREVEKAAGKMLSLAIVQSGYDGFAMYSREFRPFYPQLILNTSDVRQTPTGLPAATAAP